MENGIHRILGVKWGLPPKSLGFLLPKFLIKHVVQIHSVSQGTIIRFKADTGTNTLHAENQNLNKNEISGSYKSRKHL